MRFGQVERCDVCGRAALGGGRVDHGGTAREICGDCMDAVIAFITTRRSDIKAARRTAPDGGAK